MCSIEIQLYFTFEKYWASQGIIIYALPDNLGRYSNFMPEQVALLKHEGVLIPSAFFQPEGAP